jgi:hypothetical protein
MKGRVYRFITSFSEDQTALGIENLSESESCGNYNKAILEITYRKPDYNRLLLELQCQSTKLLGTLFAEFHEQNKKAGRCCSANDSPRKILQNHIRISFFSESNQ